MENIVKIQDSMNPDYRNMYKVFLIEDDEILRNILSRVLRKQGHAVFEFDGGEGIVKNVIDLNPDVIITDILLPKKDGIQVISSVRKVFPELPIIAISGGGKVGNIEYLELALKLGANEAIAKPIMNSKFIKTFEEVVALSKQGWVSY